MLASYESVKAQKQFEKEQLAKSTDASKSNDTFFSKLSEKILNNVQVKIQNVHARYEDVSDPENKIVLGISLNEFSIKSCDSNWTPQFISTVVDYVYKVWRVEFVWQEKLGEIKQLSMYMNHEEHFAVTQSLSAEELKKQMLKLVSILQVLTFLDEFGK